MHATNNIYQKKQIIFKAPADRRFRYRMPLAVIAEFYVEYWLHLPYSKRVLAAAAGYDRAWKQHCKMLQMELDLSRFMKNQIN